MRDRIERTVLTRASQQEAWEAVGTPAGLCSWFAGQIEGEWKVGGDAVLVWGEHRCRIRIVALEPIRRFAYEWVPGVASDDLTPGRLTVVEFTLEPMADGGTAIHLVESGFASLPAEFYVEALGNNDEGWTEELAKLEAKLAG